jgi:hypothetical protein
MRPSRILIAPVRQSRDQRVSIAGVSGIPPADIPKPTANRLLGGDRQRLGLRLSTRRILSLEATSLPRRVPSSATSARMFRLVLMAIVTYENGPTVRTRNIIAESTFLHVRPCFRRHVPVHSNWQAVSDDQLVCHDAPQR